MKMNKKNKKEKQAKLHKEEEETRSCRAFMKTKTKAVCERKRWRERRRNWVIIERKRAK